jgi:hypothetical protein
MKAMTPGHALALLLCVAITSAIAAQNEELERPSFYASQSMTVRATVEAIDHQTREVTLRMPEGDTVSFVASDEARNLGQVAVGDVVNAEYVESLSIEVVANEGFEPESGEMQAMARTKVPPSIRRLRLPRLKRSISRRTLSSCAGRMAMYRSMSRAILRISNAPKSVTS